MKKILLLVTLLILVVACTDAETDKKIAELEKKIEVLERKQDRLRMISEINNGWAVYGSLEWTFANEYFSSDEAYFPMTFDEFLELEDEEFNLMLEELKMGYIEEIGKSSSGGGGLSDWERRELDEMKQQIEINKADIKWGD